MMEHHAEPRPGRVTVHHERLVEVRHVEHRHRGQSALEGLKRSCGSLRPEERFFLEELRQWSRQVAEVFDEAPVVPGQAEETAKGTHGARLWPGGHRGYLVAVHGDDINGDHVAKIGHRRRSKGTLGDFEMVRPQSVEDSAEVLQMLTPGTTIY